MTMFFSNISDANERLKKYEDKENYDFLKTLNYSDSEIKKILKYTHLNDEINRLKELACKPDEIVNLLIADGWEKSDIDQILNKNKL